MPTIDKTTFFWQYLSPGQKGLIDEGLYLLQDLQQHPDIRITDYSYLVFPFSKAYEGYLKQLFLDLNFISLHDYHSDHFRIGMALNPYLEKRLRYRSVYDKVVQHCDGYLLADRLWTVWKKARNLVFHYFPHNLHAVTLPEAEQLITEVLDVMQESVTSCKVNSKTGSNITNAQLDALQMNNRFQKNGGANTARNNSYKPYETPY